MLKSGKDQSVVICGESGAGKTESATYILNCLTFKSGALSTLNKQIIASSELLESFGNAKTIRNRNSSRFGKFVFLNFTTVGEITGAHITTYLLEKSRIIAREPLERTYHIFPYLLFGSNQEEKSSYNLLNFEEYNYLNGTSTQSEGIDDVEGFQSVKNLMDVIGINEKTQFEYFKILSSILLIGNIEFLEDDNGAVTVKNQDGKTFYFILLNWILFVIFLKLKKKKKKKKKKKFFSNSS